MGEFDLIARYFKRNRPLALENTARAAPDSGAKSGSSGAPVVALGIGDDCALLNPAPGQHLAISTDMLAEGRHFFADVDPAALGHKALAVNLSDLAAMGAEPLAFTLALALPAERAANDAWMSGFASGLFALADEHQCTLIGGDTTAGPLNICITVFGQVPIGRALRRNGARPGDDIWVSGTLGEARLALLALEGKIALAPERLAHLRQRLERPTPRVALGLALREIASSAMDLSDGLAGDLAHLARASCVRAVLERDALARAGERQPDRLSTVNEAAYEHALIGGDDYELLFTAPADARNAVNSLAARAGVRLSRIGWVTAGEGVWLREPSGRAAAVTASSFDHFAG